MTVRPGSARLGVDAANIRAGGGLTHLGQVLSNARPQEAGFARVVVWGARATLERLPDRPWLDRVEVPALSGSTLRRALWQRFELPAWAARAGCDALLAPGGIVSPALGVPTFVISQNLLPFEPAEVARYRGSPWMTARLWSVRRAQLGSMRRAAGVLFLSRYALDTISGHLGARPARWAIVPHGIEERFFQEPRPIREDGRFRVLYVSEVERYKHQGAVAAAAVALRRRGVPVEVDFVGGSYERHVRKRFAATLAGLDPAGGFLRYHGKVPFGEIHARYRDADAFVFASTCENLPNIMIEAMAAGLPVASSGRGPMPEVLGPAGVYFDPERPAEIADALERLARDPALRSRLARAAYDRALDYSWDRCARDTFGFVGGVLFGGAPAPDEAHRAAQPLARP